MSSPQSGRGIRPSMTPGDSIEAASSVFMGDDMLPEYQDPHPPPSEAVDNLNTTFSSPIQEFLTKNSATMGKSAHSLVGDEKRFQAETRRFSFLARPQTSDDATAAFTFSAPKPTAGKYTISKTALPKLSPVLPGEKVNGEDISTRSGMSKGVRSQLQSPRVPGQCSPSPNSPGPPEKAPVDVLDSIEFPDPQTFPPAFTHNQPDLVSNLEIESQNDDHKPAPSKIPLLEPLAIETAKNGSMSDQLAIPASNFDRVKRQSHLQRPISSHKHDCNEDSTRAGPPECGLPPVDQGKKFPSRTEQSADRPFRPSKTRPAESQFRVTKVQVKARAKRQQRCSQPPPLRREVQGPLSEEDLLEMMANQLRERKTAEAASQAATEQLHAQIGALTEAYNDAYQKWHDTEKLCKEQSKAVAQYHNKCNGWKERVSGFQKFMNGLQNDIQAQVGESKKVQEEILSVRQAEQTMKAELAVVREQTLKERQQSSVSLVDTKKTIQGLEQHLKESRDSSKNSLRLLSAERIKVTQLECVIDKQNQKHDTQLQMFQSTQSALVENLVEIADVVRECKDSIMEGRKEGLPYLKKCKSLLEVLCEEDSIDPEAVDEIKNSIASLSNSIDVHLGYAEKDIETNVLSKQQPSVDFEAKFSELNALLENNHRASERMASLQETHRRLEAQLYASENAVTVAQYEIADRDSRHDLLKRRNLDLETSLKGFEDRELKCGEEIARREELNCQISLLQEALKEGGERISDLEEELRNKDGEIQQKRQKIDEISEKLQEPDIDVKSLREAVEADYERKCEEMNRTWTNHRALEKAEEICDLRNKLNQESNSKKSAEKEVEDLKASLTKFRENGTQMKVSLKKANSQKKDLEMQLSEQDHSSQVKDIKLKDLSETLQSRDADLQLLRESSDSKSTAVKEAQEKLATKERELEELKIKCGQMEMTLEKSTAQSHLGSSLMADLENKEEQVHRLEAEHNVIYTTSKAVEQTFRRMGLLHPMELFNEQAMATVAERISILQLHEAQGHMATEQQILEAPAEALPNNTSGQLAKPKRKANRSNKKHGPEQANPTIKESQIQTTIVEHQFQGMVSTTMRVEHSTPPRNKGSGADLIMTAPSLPLKHLVEDTRHHHDRQRVLPTGSSPLSNLRSSDVQTPLGSRKGLQRASLPESINGTPIHASPLTPRGNPLIPRTVPQSGAINTVTNSPEKMTGELNGRFREAAEENMHDSPRGDGKRSTVTYRSPHRSILKDSHSPRKRKRSSADRQESQILEKRVRVDAPPSRGSDEIGQQDTSGYFASTSGVKNGSMYDTPTPSKTTPGTKPASTHNSLKPRAQAQRPRLRKLKVTPPIPPNPFPAPRRSTRTSSKEQMMYGDRFSKENPYRA